MPTQVEIPDQGTVEFPDSMTPEDIKGVIQNKFYGQNAPSLPEQVVQPRMGLADMLFDPETAQNLRGAVQDVVYSLPGMAAQIPKMAYEGLKFAAGGPQERAQVGTEALTQAVAQGQQMASDVLSPAGSRESFRGIANLGLMAAPAVGEALGEAAVLGRTKPPIQGGALPQIPETPISDVVKPQTQIQGGIENAQQISENARPNVDVQLPGGEITRETDGGQVPTAVGGEGVQAGGQGETLQAPQEVEPSSAKDIKGFFASAKGAVSDSYTDAIWKKVQDGKPIERIAPLENSLREAQKAGQLKTRDDVAAIIQGYGKPAAETPTTVGETTATRQVEPVTGQPFSITAYHGTRAADQLDPSFLGLGTGAKSAKQAFFFSSNKELAQDYADTAFPKEGLDARRSLINAEAEQQKLKETFDVNLPTEKQNEMNARYDELDKVISDARETITKHQLDRGRRMELGGLQGDKEARVLEHQVELQNPYVVDFKGSDFREKTYNDILKQAKKEGRDGVIFKNTYDPASVYRPDRPTDIYAVFPETLKAQSVSEGGAGTQTPVSKESGVETPPTVSETTTGADTGSKPVTEAHPLQGQTLYRGSNTNRISSEDRFYSAHRETAEEYAAGGPGGVEGKVEEVKGETLPSKLYRAENKEELADHLGLKGDVYGTAFDNSVKEKLQAKGYEGVVYEAGTALGDLSSGGEQEVHVFSKPDTGAPPVTEAPITAEPLASEGEGRTTGIAQRITNVPANEGLSVQESVDRGQNLLSEGVNPEEVSARVKTTKQLSVDDLSVLRARTSELDKAAYAAEDAMRANPKDPVARQAWEDAVKARNDWNTDHVKPAQTIWSDLGRTQQGEADIDTGTVTGLRVAFNEAKGRDPTPVEQAKLTDYADKTKNVEGRIDEAKSKYDQAIGKESGAGGVPTTEALQEHFLSKIDPNAKSYSFTQGEISDLWKYTKANYIDKGITSLDDTIHMVSLDTGLRPEWVADALTKPKAIKSVTNELYSAMSKRRDIVNAAKDYIRAKDEPLWKKVARGTWETPFSVAIWGHGTVGGITHAGANIFRPSVWKAYWPDFVNQAKFFAKPSIHEAAIQRLVRDPNFITAKRAGLANDPNLTYTDYGAYAKFFGLQGGRRGFDALKTMRQSMFNSMWEKVPASIKSDAQASKELAKGYAEMVNHATGVISNTDRGFLGTSSRALSPVMFAAKLEASRWARVVGDPLKTLDTYAQWNKATPAEKAVAIKRTKNAAEFAAVYLGTLYLNDAILSANGSKDRINFTDPSKSDWLKHKIAGHTIAVDGGLLSPIRLLGRLTYDTLIRQRKELRGDTRTAAAIKDVGQYAIGKASPSISIAKEALTAESFDGRLLPWSRDTSKKPRMTWTEYASSHGPIPISGGIKDAYDSMRQRGMSKPDTEAVLRGLAAFGSELTGARVMEIQEPTPKTSRNR